MEEELSTQTQVREVVRSKISTQHLPTGSPAGQAVSTPQRQAGDNPRATTLASKLPVSSSPQKATAAATATASPSVGSSFAAGAVSFWKSIRPPKLPEASASFVQSLKRQ